MLDYRGSTVLLKWIVQSSAEQCFCFWNVSTLYLCAHCTSPGCVGTAGVYPSHSTVWTEAFEAYHPTSSIANNVVYIG